MSATTISPDSIPTGVYSDRPEPLERRRSRFVTWASPPSAAASGRSRAQIDASGDAPVLEGTVEVASIDTGEENRDGHLKAPRLLRRRAVPADQLPLDRHRAGRRRSDPPARRDHDQGDHEADRADRHGRRERPGSVGQRARRARARGQDRSPRVRPEVEPDAPERQPAGRQRGQAARQRLGGQGQLRR